MSHTINKAFLIKCVLIHNFSEIISHFVLILKVGHIPLYIVYHFDNLDIRSAMLRAFKWWQCCGNYRVCITSGWRYDTSCKCWVITAAMLHMKHKCNVKNSCLKLRIASVRSKHHQYIFSCWKLFIRSVDIHTSVQIVMAVCLIAVNRKHRECTYQIKALSEHIFDGLVRHIVVISGKRKHAFCKRIHNIVAWSLHNNISCEVCRKSSAFT